jgi:hypothetical protein
VTDRPTKAHEYVFLLTKSPRYFFDQEAVKEQKAKSTVSDGRGNNNGARRERGFTGSPSMGGTNLGGPEGGRNIRTVWTIATQPFPEAHFATFPEELALRCILAGTSEKGVCPKCGGPWRRVIESKKISTPSNATSYADAHGPDGRDSCRASLETKTIGWKPTCKCGEERTVAAVVLDPFAGSGTVGTVAEYFGRGFVGIELSKKYIEIAKRRIGSGPRSKKILSGDFFGTKIPVKKKIKNVPVGQMGFGFK